MIIGKAALMTLIACLGQGGGLMAATPHVKLGPWYTTGPLKAQAFGDVLFPEKGVDLSAKSPTGEPLWMPRPQWRDGQPQELPSAGGRASTYLFRTITTDKAAQASAGLGSDDGLEVWLNGKKLLSKDVARGVLPSDDTVILDLQQGENRLLLKIHNQPGGHGFFFELGTGPFYGVPSTRAAIEHLVATYGGKYSKGPEFLGRLTELEKALKEAEAALAGGDQAAKQRLAEMADRFAVLQREALLANPLLDFDKLLLIKRGAGNLGLPQNWQANCGIGSRGYDNEIAVLSPIGPQGKLTTLMKPQKSDFVGDLKLDFDAERMLFSMPGAHDRWQVWEMKADGSGLRQATPGDEPDVDNYDPCYLPDGRILVGCHDTQNSSPSAKPTMAGQRQPSDISPWYGPARGFSFKREVQPVLDKYCVGCHKDSAQPQNGQAVPDFTAKKERGWNGFTPSYIALHPFVRRPGPESDYHLQKPLEFHADTSELVQMLKRGHHNVKLDAEAWDRLITWIDLNVPDHGTWTEQVGGPRPVMARRMAMHAQYANRTGDPEQILDAGSKEPVKYVAPAPMPARKPQDLRVRGWPFDATEASRRQAAVNLPAKVKIELKGSTPVELALIPAGEFVMGDAAGEADEVPVSRVKIDQPFYLGVVEVRNDQYAAFDAEHDSGVISMVSKDQDTRGHDVNQPSQPVVRVTWSEALGFCEWLSQKTGRKFTLPTEAQWEWACRAGTDSPFFYGNRDTDFGKFANLADASISGLQRADSPAWHPRDGRFNDGAMVTANVGRYQPNAWGLHDMHGNAAEWTLSSYRPYPYDDHDGRNAPNSVEMKTVRGGSWYDRPIHARSAARLPYRPWQAVYNIGFRVAMLAE